MNTGFARQGAKLQQECCFTLGNVLRTGMNIALRYNVLWQSYKDTVIMRLSATLGLCMYSLYGLPFFAVSARGVDSPQKMEARIKCADNHR